jgi:hypothetical protein
MKKFFKKFFDFSRHFLLFCFEKEQKKTALLRAVFSHAFLSNLAWQERQVTVRM